MENLTRFVEVRLKLVVNQAKSKATPLKQCAFLGFQIGAVGKAVWTIKAHARFKRRVREITRRNRGHRVQDISADEYPVKIQKTAIVDRRPLPDACQAIKCAAAAKKQ
jgi:hypothetical protein